MMSQSNEGGRDLIRRWAETWRTAGPELEAIRRCEAASAPIHQTIRQLFEGMETVFAAPAPLTSGLVEQQEWFTKIRTAAANRKPALPDRNE
jgi:hypothetical protein